MKKILLVEDDKSLREIYAVRLVEEGYDIVSAGDGEQALAMAIKERPVLIISDVMMPKISGFDMLDILRSTTETKDIKVIIMTALSSEDQRSRGEQLGADKYLVKSQVGIEDVVHAVHEVLRDTEAPQAAPSATPAPAAAPASVSPTAAPRPAAPTTVPPRPAPAQPAAPAGPTEPSLPQPTTFTTPAPAPAPQPVAPQAPAPSPAPQPAPAPASPANTVPSPSGSTARVIEPLSSLDNTNDMDALAAKIDQELNTEPAAPQPSVQPTPPSVSLPTPPPVPPSPFGNPPQTPPPAAPGAV